MPSDLTGVPMRKISLISFFLASVLLLTSQQQTVLAYRHPSTGISFPVLLGEMKRGEVTNFEENQRGLGLGVSYSATNVAVADVFVYDLGLKTIPDDLRSKQVLSHFSQVKGDIGRTYQSVQQLSENVSSTARAGSDSMFRALSAHFSYIHPNDGGERRSYIYLTVYNDNFVKVRFSYRKENETEARKLLPTFLNDLGRLLVKKPTI
jgi:hypothetical protein